MSNSKNNFQKFIFYFDKYGYLILLFILIIPTISALFIPGFYGASDDVHIAWLFEMHRSLSMGQFPPRFVPDLSYGFGYPLFNFVFPLPFYLGEIFHLLGLSFVDSIKAVFFVSMFLSGLFMYFLIGQYTKSKLINLTGAIIYSYSTYRAVDLYIRGAIGEILSFVFFPLILLSIIKVSRKLNIRWLGIGGISVGGLVLTHNIATYMFLPVVAFFVLIQLFFIRSKIKFLAESLVILIFGLLISSYFWLPALLDSSLMKYDTVFDFKDHFPTLKQLSIPFWGYGASVPGPYDGLSFNIGTINLIVLGTGILFGFYYWRRLEVEKKILLIWGVLVMILTVFMMNFRSTYLWEHIPLLPYFQFPWRFLMMTTFITPLFIVFVDKFIYKNQLVLILLILAVILNISNFRPQDFLGRQDNYYLDKYIPLPNASETYNNQQEEYLRLPKDTSKRPTQSLPLVQIGENLETVKFTQINPLNTHIQIDTPQQAVVSYNRYYFPGWKVLVNGQEQLVSPGRPYGQIQVLVPAGKSNLEIFFTETSFKIMLDLVSLGVFLLSLVLIWMPKKLTKD
jgi:hypothetical protein